MKFGVEIPTCTAGMMYPVPFATAQDAVRVAAEAEQLGYSDVAGNDHLSTQQYVREAWPRPPAYFEPLITLGERRGPHVRRAPDHGNPGALDARPRAPGEAGGDARSAQRWPRHARGRGRRIPRRVRKRRARPAGRAPGRPGDRGPRSTARPLRRAALDVSREVSAIRWTSSRFRSLQSPLPIYSGGQRPRIDAARRTAVRGMAARQDRARARPRGPARRVRVRPAGRARSIEDLHSSPVRRVPRKGGRRGASAVRALGVRPVP